MTDIESRLRAEVETLHQVLAAWFRGDAPADRQHFETRLAGRFADDCRIVYPSGRVLDRNGLFDPIFAAHGSNPKFAVAVRDFRLIAVSEDGSLATACYIEDQVNALNTVPANNARMSTVVFRLLNEGQKIEWVHIHETAIS